MSEDKKIRTGLPYKPEEMSKIYEEGAIVDLSDINFPTCENMQKNAHAAFVYLRNTGYNVDFDFSNMSYKQKVVLLKEYLDTKIEYDIPVLDTTWLCILYACIGERVKDMPSILSDDELVDFKVDEFHYINRIWDFVVSLPIFLIKRIDTELVYDNIEKTDEDFNLTNFINLLSYPELDTLIVKTSGEIPLKDYTKVFVLENTKLFDALQNFSFAVFLQGLIGAENEEFADFLRNLYDASVGEIPEENKEEGNDQEE